MITVTNDRNAALQAGWLALSERSPEIEGNNFDGFNIRAFKDGETVIGMLMTRGPELHVAILPNFRRRWLSRKLIKEVIGELLEKYGYIVTSVMHDNLIGQDFVERLGFERNSYNNGIIYYRMTL